MLVIEKGDKSMKGMFHVFIVAIDNKEIKSDAVRGWCLHACVYDRDLYIYIYAVDAVQATADLLNSIKTENASNNNDDASHIDHITTLSLITAAVLH